ncbi:MAG: uncharacterized protein QOE63_1649 [Acidimicrobiaceae bacterium]
MQVAELWRFPVKSMQGQSVERLALDTSGAAGDRLWGVIDLEAGKVLSAKRTASLLDAQAMLDDATGAVTITLPDGTQLAAGDPATDAALSAWLGKEVRLSGPGAEAIPYELTMDPTDDGSEVWDFATPPGSFVDLAAAHLLTTASVAAAAAAYPEGQWSVRRFRPTVLIDSGDGEGFVEDDWVGHDVQVGGATCNPFMATPRCAMPTRAQSLHGLERDTAISRTLTDVHRNDLGVYCAVAAAGPVALGDAVTVRPA